LPSLKPIPTSAIQLFHLESSPSAIVRHVLHRAGQPIKCYKRAWNRACKEALRCEDVDLDRLPYGWIWFRAEHDKTGNEQWVPITEKARRVLAEHRLRMFDSEWLFPSERKSGHPVDRSTMDRRLKAAYEKAELQLSKGGLWHPWRRKWATGRNDLPVKDVAAPGGWSDTETLLQSYQQADEATVTRVILSAPKLTRERIVG
jgi:integrase